jgi:hypothetical protein
VTPSPEEVLIQEEAKCMAPQTLYDSLWIQEKAKSSMSNDEFEELIDDLKDNDTLTRERAKEIRKEFRNIKNKIAKKEEERQRLIIEEESK